MTLRLDGDGNGGLVRTIELSELQDHLKSDYGALLSDEVPQTNVIIANLHLVSFFYNYF
jgi:hypothetical protein